MQKVSIVTPCYNCQDFIEETFQTVIDQTYQHWEWLLVNDCSTDETDTKLLEIASRDDRIKVFKNDTNCGAAVCRNVGMNNSSGEFIAFLDSDDLWSPEKLNLQVHHALQNNLDFTYHDYQTVDSQGSMLKEMRLKSTYTTKDLLRFNPFATSSIMVKRDIVFKNNVRFKEHLRRRQDYLFWYDSIAVSKNVMGLAQNLSGYRLGNAGSLSANKVKMAKIQWELYRNEFELSLIKSAWYTFHYAAHGMKKYFIPW